MAAQHLRTIQHVKNKKQISVQLEERVQSHEGNGGQHSIEEGSSHEHPSQVELLPLASASNVDLTLVDHCPAGPSQASSSEAGPGQPDPSMTDGSEVRETVATVMGNRRQQFHEDICYTFMACDIPLNNVSKEPMKDLFKKYVGRNLPDQSTLRKYNVHIMYENTLIKLRAKSKGQKLWVSIDESTDVEHRCVACFVFGILGVEGERKKMLFKQCFSSFQCES